MEDKGRDKVVISTKDGFGIGGDRGYGKEKVIDGEGVGADWLW